MSRLSELKAAKSLDHLAKLLGFRPSSITFLIYKLPPTSRYTTFDILKRDGSPRRIDAPCDRLKLLQRRLADLLYDCYVEIESGPRLRRTISHGFVRGRSILSNASNHKRRRYILNIDINDFFPSFNFGRVRGYFIKNKSFELDAKIATYIAQIACWNNALPQGSPCSPVITNLLGHLLDIRMVRLSRSLKCTYTRYADDLTFSTSQAIFPPDLAYADPPGSKQWKIGKKLVDEIKRVGFGLNEKKTRMQIRGSRQCVTGLVVNEKVNVSQDYYRLSRSMCHELFKTGSYYQKIPATLRGGKKGDPDIREAKASTYTLQGMLEHIYHIRNTVDRRPIHDKRDKKKSTSTRNLYHKFLFFVNFIMPDKVMLLPEGSSDAIYIRSAIEMSKRFHPDLGEFVSGKFIMKVRLLHYTRKIHDVVRLGGGTGDLCNFIHSYAELAAKYKFRPMQHPVIIVVDNDDGAKGVFNAVKAKSGGLSAPSLTSMEPFYHIVLNLYLVKVPEKAAPSGGGACIESLFDSSVLSIEIDGKKFDPSNEYNHSTSYGKVVLAEKIVRPQRRSIDFTRFEELLERIRLAIEDYKTRFAGTGP